MAFVGFDSNVNSDLFIKTLYSRAFSKLRNFFKAYHGSRPTTTQNNLLVSKAVT